MMDTDRSLPSLFLPLFLLLLCSQFYVTQEQGQPPRPSNINNGFTQATALMIIILTAAIFFTGFFFLCIRSRRRAAVNTRFRTFITEMRPPNRGLDPALIGMFPTMVYSDVKGLKMSDFQLECAVCLCEFDDDDELTLLPVCDHVFHSNCIGTWLTSHSTCPVCRANLNNSLPETVAEVIPIAENPGENREVAGEETLIDKNLEARVEEDDQLRRMGSKRNISGRIISQWRSRSARPAVGRSGSRTTVGNTWDEEERERFTLRLPESVRKDLVSGTSTLRRSATVKTLLFPHIGEESSRMGYRGEGRSYILGKSARETARSGRQWGFGGDWGSGSSRGKGIADGGLLD